jgi:hypothetical protein
MQSINQGDSLVSRETKEIMVKLVTSLLTHKPSDPVPHIYSYLQEIKKGGVIGEIVAINDNELNELRNLEKKVAYLKDQLGSGDQHTDTEEEESDEEVEDIQPKKKNINKQRAGVSAEAYGAHNKKGEYVAKVIEKSEATK